jgi:hypothetical protein
VSDVETSSGAAVGSAERVARNEATFRSANEAIEAAAARSELEEPLPVLCECADPACTEILRLSVQQYEEVRAEPRWFVNAVGHEVNSGAWGRVVAEREGYVIVAKSGEAGEIAAELDPRTERPT